MKKIDVGQLIAILANVGVIMGLIFVGVQLRQDRDIAQIDRRLTRVDNRMYWVDLIAQNSTVWTKGLSGEPLSDAEWETFDALAGAWQFDTYQGWRISQSDAFEVDREITPEVTESILREAALKIDSSPGLRRWVEETHERFRQTGRFGFFNELLEAELAKLDERGQLVLTRFRGHLTLTRRGVYDAENKKALPTGISRADGRAGPGRSVTRGAVAGV